MKQHIFTQEEKSELESNPHIIKVMNCNVEYISYLIYKGGQRAYLSAPR